MIKIRRIKIKTFNDIKALKQRELKILLFENEIEKKDIKIAVLEKEAKEREIKIALLGGISSRITSVIQVTVNFLVD